MAWRGESALGTGELGPCRRQEGEGEGEEGAVLGLGGGPGRAEGGAGLPRHPAVGPRQAVHRQGPGWAHRYTLSNQHVQRGSLAPWLYHSLEQGDGKPVKPLNPVFRPVAADDVTQLSPLGHDGQLPGLVGEDA